LHVIRARISTQLFPDRAVLRALSRASLGCALGRGAAFLRARGRAGVRQPLGYGAALRAPARRDDALEPDRARPANRPAAARGSLAGNFVAAVCNLLLRLSAAQYVLRESCQRHSRLAAARARL